MPIVVENRFQKWPKGLSIMENRLPDSPASICSEKIRLMEAFLQTIRDLATLQSEQAKSVIEGDPDFSRFDLLIHMANEKKDHAKYAWMLHVEKHGC